MTRFHRTRNSGFRGRAITLLAAATCMASAAQAAAPERVIFAAENALYGAGFDIGRADGWLDGKLRAAIRGYQTANGLQVNGNLDAATLKVLGVNAVPASTIARNSVASRQKSADVLGLSSPEPKPPAPKIATVQPQPKPEPQTTLKPRQEPAQLVETPELREKPEKRIESATISKKESKEIPSVSKETSNQGEVEPTGETVVLAAKTEPVVAEAPAPVSEPEPVLAVVETKPSQSSSDVRPVLAKVSNEPSGREARQPEQPIAQEPEIPQAIQTDNPEPAHKATTDRSHDSGGGFFSALFDFFFGWLV